LSALEEEIVAWLGAGADRVIETACAHVILAGPTAYKLKRHRDLGYADFSTAEKRKWALDRELSFNKAAAPDIYRQVRRLTREATGALALDGQGEPLDYVLEMRRFDETAVLDVHAEQVDGDLAERLGRQIARFHAGAPLRWEGGVHSMDFTVGSNADLLRELAPELGADRVETLIAATQAEFDRRRPLLVERTAEGFARRCHGDLHLANILMEDGAPVLFDCIEFNDLLSDIDVQYDLAFLLMDLEFRGRRDAAARALAAWLDEAARTFPEMIWEGLAALPLMLSVRAGVRTHVEAHGGRLDRARAYMEAAIAHLDPAPPRLAAVGGLSGSGKSTFARAIAPALGRSPGAVVLRTDEIRKRMLKVPTNEKLPRSAYATELYPHSYDVLFDNARTLLAAGQSVVLDATFIDPALRARAVRLGQEAGVPFEGVWLDAPRQVLEERISNRVGDVSDADLQTLQDQLARLQTPVEWTNVDGSQTTAAAAQAWLSGRVASER
jgi:aminoglycoside phosphotransferase family enzyme/predicted kinase